MAIEQLALVRQPLIGQSFKILVGIARRVGVGRGDAVLSRDRRWVVFTAGDGVGDACAYLSAPGCLKPPVEQTAQALATCGAGTWTASDAPLESQEAKRISTKRNRAILNAENRQL
jgi:hypothetical protein